MKNYKETIEDYDNGVNWHIQKSSSYNWTKQINTFVKMINGTRVLDAGCGGGRDIPEFIKRDMIVEGIDYSAKTIELCRKKFPEVTFYEGDIRNMNLSDQTYEGVWACASILNIEKREIPLALSEFRRILKKNGALFISVKEGTGEKIIADQAGKRFFSFFSVKEIRALVEQAGFKIKHAEITSDADLTGEKNSHDKPSWICLYAVNS
ncbi:MAG: class I SAM-dependent methyltransferase [Candidatus Nanoarchaeia archaeon]